MMFKSWTALHICLQFLSTTSLSRMAAGAGTSCSFFPRKASLNISTEGHGKKSWAILGNEEQRLLVSMVLPVWQPFT